MKTQILDLFSGRRLLMVLECTKFERTENTMQIFLYSQIHERIICKIHSGSLLAIKHHEGNQIPRKYRKKDNYLEWAFLHQKIFSAIEIVNIILGILVSYDKSQRYFNTLKLMVKIQLLSIGFSSEAILYISCGYMNAERFMKVWIYSLLILIILTLNK